MEGHPIEEFELQVVTKLKWSGEPRHVQALAETLEKALHTLLDEDIEVMVVDSIELREHLKTAWRMRDITRSDRGEGRQPAA